MNSLTLIDNLINCIDNAIATESDNCNVDIMKQSKQQKKCKHKLYTNYRVRDKEQRRKAMQRKTMETIVMSQSQTERKPPSIGMKQKKKAQEKRVAFTNTGDKVSKTLAKMRRKMAELNQTQDKPLKRHMRTPRDIRRQSKKSDYIQRKSVGRGFDLFNNYRIKFKEEDQKKEGKQVQIETQLREKKTLMKPDKLDKRYKKNGERMKQGKRKKVEISSPFETKLTETMYDHRPSLRGKLKKKGERMKQDQRKKIEILRKRTNVNIEYKKGTEISVTAITPRLTIRPVQYDDVEFHQNELFGAQEVMKAYASGDIRLYWNKTDTKEINYAKTRVQNWRKRWDENNPFSGYTVLDTASQNKLGIIVVGGGELAFLFAKDAWGNGYGTESVAVLIHIIIPYLYKNGFSMNLDQIYATVHPDNVASRRVMEKAGLETDNNVTFRQFGDKSFPRLTFVVTIDSLIENSKYQGI